MALDIIVVNYNSGPYLKSCLESIYQQGKSDFDRIIVVDNGSRDHSAEQALHACPEITLISNRINRGFAAAVNQALGQSRAEQILLINPDVIVLPGTIGRLQDFMSRHPRCGIVGGEILDRDGRYQPTARRFPGYFNVLFGRRSWLSRLMPGNPGSRRYLYLDLDRRQPQQVDFLEGSLLLIRRRALEQTGPLDENFFLYLEDADLCRRMKELGWETCWLPRAYAIHIRGENIRLDNIHPMRHHSRSLFRYFIKHRQPIAPIRAGLYFFLWLRYAYILGSEFAKKGFLCC